MAAMLFALAGGEAASRFSQLSVLWSTRTLGHARIEDEDDLVRVYGQPLSFASG